MTDVQESILQRIADSLERLADHFAPRPDNRERQPAILGTATYNREEREKQELRKKLESRVPKLS